jgi:hypothetical protein
MAAYDGERFAVQGQYGLVLIDGAFAFANDWAFAERVFDELGWRSHSSVTHPFQRLENYRMTQMQEASRRGPVAHAVELQRRAAAHVSRDGVLFMLLSIPPPRFLLG